MTKTPVRGNSNRFGEPVQMETGYNRLTAAALLMVR